jgi:hypothetical protein
MKRYNKGIIDEDIVLPQIKKYFNREITKLNERYGKYDFACDNYKYELKSRNNELNKYPTTMIGVDKLNKNVILLFKFTDDKLAFIEYNEEQFKSYERKLFTKYTIPKEHIYIPIKDLTIMC